MKESKFYRTVIQVEILSEEPYHETALNKIHHDITLGPCSGLIDVIKAEEITPEKMAECLIRQGSNPEFFGLTVKGEVLDES